MPDTTPQGSSSPEDAPTPDHAAPESSNTDSSDDFLDRIRQAAKQMRPEQPDEETPEEPLDIDSLSLASAIESKPAAEISDDGFAQAFVSKLAEVEQDIETRLSSKDAEPVDVMDLTAEADVAPAEPAAAEAPRAESDKPSEDTRSEGSESDSRDDEKSTGRRRRRRRSRKDKRDASPKRAEASEDTSGEADDTDASGQLSESYHKGTLGAAAKKKRPPFIEYDEPLTMPQPNEELLQKLRAELATLDNAAVVRYGAMRDIGLFEHHLDTPPTPGTRVVVRTDRGVELGKVLTRLATAEELGDDPGQQVPQADEPEDMPQDDPSSLEPAEAPIPEAGQDAVDADAGCSQDGCPSNGGGCGSGGCGNKSSYGKLDREQLAIFLAANGEKYSFHRGGKLLRVANTQDLADAKTVEEHRAEQLSYCREQIRALSLKMRLVTAETLLGGERMVFYFTSEDRVDFRDLVKQLTTRFRTRVELRQVGARDEARLVGDYERCGRRCCCQAFVKDLLPVSMRMAKLQKATLDPSKISGRCSRLMCCLRYEDESYRELKKNLPNKSMWVRTETMIGKVLDSQVLCQLVKLRLPDGTIETVGVEEILERNVPEPELPAPRDSRNGGMRRPTSQRRPLRDEPVAANPDGGVDGASSAGESDKPQSDRPAKKRRPRRRRRKKGGGSGGGGGEGSGSNGPAPQAQ